MEIIDFNMNNYVHVKLTPRGVAMLKCHHEAIFTGYLAEKYTFTPPKTDDEGFSRWQLWDFMQRVGPHIGMGMENPVETGIRFEVETP